MNKKEILMSEIRKEILKLKKDLNSKELEWVAENIYEITLLYIHDATWISIGEYIRLKRIISLYNENFEIIENKICLDQSFLYEMVKKTLEKFDYIVNG